jgi:hypothetical protein
MIATESDVHIENEIVAADEEWENARDYERCLPGCPHFGRCDYWEGF